MKESSPNNRLNIYEICYLTQKFRQPRFKNSACSATVSVPGGVEVSTFRRGIPHTPPDVLSNLVATIHIRSHRHFWSTWQYDSFLVQEKRYHIYLTHTFKDSHSLVSCFASPVSARTRSRLVCSRLLRMRSFIVTWKFVNHNTWWILYVCKVPKQAILRLVLLLEYYRYYHSYWCNISGLDYY